MARVCTRHRRLVGHRARDRADAARRGLRPDARLAPAGADRGGGRRARRRRRSPRTSRRRRSARASSPSTATASAASTSSSTRPGSGSAAGSRICRLKHLDLQLDVNLRGLFLVTQAAIPLLRESRGWIVNLASIAGTLPTPGLATYGATKAAVIALTRSLNDELDADGVRAIALCPGFVDTPMAQWSGLEPDEMIRARGLRRGRAHVPAPEPARAHPAGRDRAHGLPRRRRLVGQAKSSSRDSKFAGRADDLPDHVKPEDGGEAEACDAEPLDRVGTHEQRR